MMQRATYIQVFEHQTLRLHEQGLTQRHLDALAAYNERHNNRYFTLVHRGLRFRQYVGVLQVGALCIEILPKTDRHPNAQQWQHVLLELLYHAGILSHYQWTRSDLSPQSSPLLSLYIESFTQTVEQLLQSGLTKQYRQQEQNSHRWKGQVNFARHLQKNWRHPQRVYSRLQVYDYQHATHQVLYQTLQTIQQGWIPPVLRQKVNHLLRAFPSQAPRRITNDLIDELLARPALTRYERALELARLIVLPYRSNLQAGTYPVLALLFDMNLLFERYLQHQLRRYLDRSWTLRAQARRRFWADRELRPDLWLEHQGQHYILDAKWKILQQPQPSSADLRQMFAYNHSFRATQSVLVYPNVFDFTPQRAPYVAPLHLNGEAQSHYCQVIFVNILDEQGRLNRSLAKDLMTQLLQPPAS